MNFDQWKQFSENYKPMRIWLGFVYKFTDNYCYSRLFSEFIQTQTQFYPIGGNLINTVTLINQWCQRWCFASCNKKHCNIDIEDKTAVAVFTKLSHFDMFNIY